MFSLILFLLFMGLFSITRYFHARPGGSASLYDFGRDAAPSDDDAGRRARHCLPPFGAKNLPSLAITPLRGASKRRCFDDRAISFDSLSCSSLALPLPPAAYFHGHRDFHASRFYRPALALMLPDGQRWASHEGSPRQPRRRRDTSSFTLQAQRRCGFPTAVALISSIRYAMIMLPPIIRGFRGCVAPHGYGRWLPLPLAAVARRRAIRRLSRRVIACSGVAPSRCFFILPVWFQYYRKSIRASRILAALKHRHCCFYVRTRDRLRIVLFRCFIDLCVISCQSRYRGDHAKYFWL